MALGQPCVRVCRNFGGPREVLGQGFEVYIFHEMSAAIQWAQGDGTIKSLSFREFCLDGDGNGPSQLHVGLIIGGVGQL